MNTDDILLSVKNKSNSDEAQVTVLLKALDQLKLNMDSAKSAYENMSEYTPLSEKEQINRTYDLALASYTRIKIRMHHLNKALRDGVDYEHRVLDEDWRIRERLRQQLEDLAYQKRTSRKK